MFVIAVETSAAGGGAAVSVTTAFVNAFDFVFSFVEGVVAFK